MLHFRAFPEGSVGRNGRSPIKGIDTPNETPVSNAFFKVEMEKAR